MKKEIIFPDWTRTEGWIITRNKENDPRPIWRTYEQDPDRDALSLRVTLEIAGGSTICERFDSPEARAAAYAERSRQTTWRNAIAFAEHLWRVVPARKYVVLFRPENPNVGPETICIYQQLSPYPATGRVVYE